MDKKDMLKEALSVYRKPLNQLEDALAGKDGDVWFAEFKRFLRKEPCWVRIPGSETVYPARKSSELLKFCGTVLIAAMTEKFIANDKFVVNTENDAEVKISYIGPLFQKEFLDGKGIVDEPRPTAILCRHKLKCNSLDKPILVDLGGREETTLSELYALMRKQRRGQKGKLLANGWANIFYIRSFGGVLFAVGVRWVGLGWRVEAISVKLPDEWHSGILVFSRDSALRLSGQAPLSTAGTTTGSSESSPESAPTD